MADSASRAAVAPRALAHPQAHYGPVARWLLGWLFAPVVFPEEPVPTLQKTAAEATPVYVLRSSSLLHLMFFNFIFARLGLPLARASTGLGYRIFAPFAR